MFRNFWRSGVIVVSTRIRLRIRLRVRQQPIKLRMLAEPLHLTRADVVDRTHDLHLASARKCSASADTSCRRSRSGGIRISNAFKR